MMKNSRVQRNLPTVAANASVPVVHILEIGEQIGTFGPEAAWKIYEATRRDDHEVGWRHVGVYGVYGVRCLVKRWSESNMGVRPHSALKERCRGNLDCSRKGS